MKCILCHVKYKFISRSLVYNFNIHKGTILRGNYRLNRKFTEKVDLNYAFNAQVI